MSLPPQPKPNAKRTGKRITFFSEQGLAMKEPVQHAGGAYYGLGQPGPELPHSEVPMAEGRGLHVGNSVIFGPEKGEQTRGHYQPMKWAEQDAATAATTQQQGGAGGWGQESHDTSWLMNMMPYITGPSAGAGLPPRRGPDKQQQQLPSNPTSYRDVDWDHAQYPPFQQGVSGSVLQPFQQAFGQSKQHHATNLQPSYYQVFPGTRGLHSFDYGAHQKPQQPQQQQPLILPEHYPQHFHDYYRNTQHPQTQPFPIDAPKPPAPRRSRRLSKEGVAPPVDGPDPTPWGQVTTEGRGAVTQVESTIPVTTGVIQVPRRKRRVSQEVNLETLAQKASEMESLPARVVKPSDADSSSAKRCRDDSLVPLVIPVSVPVQRSDKPASVGKEQNTESLGWAQHHPDRPGSTHTEHKPSVIVSRHRPARGSPSEDGSGDGSRDDEGKLAKLKRSRPRPEPLFIPPPKPGTFIPPPVYHTITPYQSHLRSPVRLIDNPLTMPPYTPPPILSPVREGSGLYFSTILSSVAAGNQSLPPPATPKSAARSLLRSTSSDITPPVLHSMGEATPVSIEPRINIGVKYQAEVPDMKDRSAAQHDQHQADVVWLPHADMESDQALKKRVDDLMHLACSSAMFGGGTNQELALHCLHECKGNIVEALSLLLLKNPIFSKAHPLGRYHYSGSDNWTPSERGFFNKGIAAYKKDFFLVQKLVRTKTVAQCVEFYYTYKKQVKLGRNGVLIYGEAEPAEPRASDAEVDVKSSQRFEAAKEEDCDKKVDGLYEGKRGSSPEKAGQTQAASEREHSGKEQPVQIRQLPQPEPHPPPAPLPRSEPAATTKKGGATVTPKAPQEQDTVFPCKKCGRVFYKVKSRSAHMKSHAEQEKKAAALRQREAEERAAARAAAVEAAESQQNGPRGRVRGRGSSSEDSLDEEEDEEWH